MTRAGRAGMLSERKSHDSTMKSPEYGSMTSKRRRNRGFKSLEISCRIHRRAARRSQQSRIFGGVLLEPGAKSSKGSEKGGGANKYYRL